MLIEKEATTTLRASSALSGSFVASSSLDVPTASYVDLFFAYVKGGSATACEVYVEVQPEGSSTWHTIEALSPAAVSGGLSAVTVARPIYTITASESVRLSVPVFGARSLRVRARETGTVGGTLEVLAVASRVGA
jgi:hypothetical protein